VGQKTDHFKTLQLLQTMTQRCIPTPDKEVYILYKDHTLMSSHTRVTNF